MPQQAAPASVFCRRRRTPTILSIGVDSNQNHLHPGKVLTSMLKRVDNAVYDVFANGVDGFEPGVTTMGLDNDGVGYALDDNNAALDHRRDEGSCG